MGRLITFVVALTFAIIGTLVFMAGNRTGLLAGNNATLIGTGCFMFSGLAWCVYGATFRRSAGSEEKLPK